MHGAKSVVYQRYIRLEQVWVLAVALGLDLWLAGCRTAIEPLQEGRGRYEWISPSVIASRASCRRLHVLSSSHEAFGQNRPRIFRL
jgi:hypothetical protein